VIQAVGLDMCTTGRLFLTQRSIGRLLFTVSLVRITT
jgi:hypothetical protein